MTQDLFLQSLQSAINTPFYINTLLSGKFQLSNEVLDGCMTAGFLTKTHQSFGSHLVQ